MEKTARLVLAPEKGGVMLDGELVSLTTTEYKVLEQLVTFKGNIMSKQQLSSLWSAKGVKPNTVEVFVLYLRRKLHKPGAKEIITTCRGWGYTIKPENIA